MDTDQLKKDFLPKDLALKLHCDTKNLTTIEEKVAIINSYAESMKQHFDPDIYAIKLNNEIAFIYWQGDAYKSAIRHYLIVTQYLKANDYPFLYFHIVGLLIRLYRYIKNYREAKAWVEIAFEHITLADSSFTVLTILSEYANLLIDASLSFDDAQANLIDKVINEIGVNIERSNAVDDILAIKKLNQLWNKKLSEVIVSINKKEVEKEKALRDFSESCEVQWYRNYSITLLEKT